MYHQNTQTKVIVGMLSRRDVTTRAIKQLYPQWTLVRLRYYTVRSPSCMRDISPLPNMIFTNFITNNKVYYRSIKQSLNQHAFA